ncbi:hypothetical protein K227x_48070 [Rubripirellula lacrimiformis]|uniref:Uncharacterized protein n=1 Tax=Rubripirellula lacrimiformis TaxID=1930273 RepID=A0A517NH38_9BACT|nr:histidine kinase [Rubripirellula lacrimiformis]QDT06398.1 hypothetical protein K227x_48070 [Rubripirellula lacrimiformis]
MNADANDRVVMLSGDLMFGSRVKSSAERAGWKFYLGGRLPDGDLDDVRYVIVDLATRSGVVDTIVAQCADRCANANLIAYGPHVHVEKLKKAREAGIPRVITNGQFDAMLSTMFD